MTSKEAERLVALQRVQAEGEARKISRRWDTEPELIAYEMAEGKLQHFRGFLQGDEEVFNAYFVEDDPKHRLMHKFFKRGLSQLSREMEEGSIVMPEVIEGEFDVLTTPQAVLRCQYTTYADGTICGVRYQGVRSEVEVLANPLMIVPASAILTDQVSIHPVAS